MEMSSPGSQMLKEISEIPGVLKKLSTAHYSNTTAKSLLKNHGFGSIVLLARGTSDNAAYFFKYLIEMKLGLPCGLASPSTATMYSTQFHYENTLVIAISQSGQSNDILTFASTAQKGGAFVLSLTNNEGSPLAKSSDLHLPLLAGPEIAIPATKSYVAQLMMAYLLTTSWASETNLSEEIFENADRCVADSTHQEFAGEIDLSKPIYILGRGFSYPNAKEFALKLQETCLVPVQGMATSDFLHGPIASLNSESQIIFMAPDKMPKDSFGEAPSRVREIGAKIFWIGNASRPQANETCLTSPESTSAESASITDAIHFQKITQQLAVSAGLDPDRPKGLSKITITR